MTKMATRLFVCQPMDGVPMVEIETTRDRVAAEASLSVDGPVEVIDTVFDGEESTDNLGHAIREIVGADAAGFAYGWRESAKCRTEHDACTTFEIPILVDEEEA